MASMRLVPVDDQIDNVGEAIQNGLADPEIHIGCSYGTLRRLRQDLTDLTRGIRGLSLEEFPSRC
jgi:hypothetical protein